MSAFEIRSHATIHAEPFAYCAHAHMAQQPGGAWVAVFNRAPRRQQVLHPPQDPLFANYVTRSLDEGATWSAPTPVPDYSWTGTECAGLTALANGRFMLNQWRFDWFPAPLVEAGLVPETTLDPDGLAQSLAGSQEIDDWSKLAGEAKRVFPWYRGYGEAWVRLSDDGGLTFRRSVRLDTAPYRGAYGMRGGVVLVDGSIILPLSDAPVNHVTFGVRSRDNGETWTRPFVIAEEPEFDFEEAGGIVTRTGRVIYLLRELKTRTLFRVHSDDGGVTWSKPRATGLPEYPANPFRLADGRIAVIVGRRIPPFGIRIYLSEDEGETFAWERPIEVRALPNKDLGYPTAAVRADGTVVAIYYARLDDGITGIRQTVLTID